ncbi:MAG: DoxX family protein [Bacteroidota bacterium]
MDKEKLIDWGFRFIAAAILIQMLFYKLGAHPDSILLFSRLGLEPVGRVGVGIVELIVTILLLVPETLKYGIVLGLGIMVGAVGSHLFVLGIEFNNDGGRLFFLALVTTVSLLVLAYRHRSNLKSLLPGTAAS